MIALREYCASDLESLVKLANNEKVSRYLRDRFPYPYTRKDGEWWISTGSKQPDVISRVIDAQGQLVGGIGIELNSGERSHIGEIGYWIAEEYWGKGLATAAVGQMTDYGFSTLGLRKLCAPVLAPNTASMRVLTKCGYSCEGVLLGEVHKQGSYLDIHLYARNR